MTSSLSTPLHEPLATALREETARAHETAEHSVFMSRLMDGSLSAQAVADLTAQLWWIYQALEQGIRLNAEHPTVAAVYDPRLERTTNLESDLKAMLGQDWRERITITQATQRYAEHLRNIATSPQRIAAHHYVRYLGDISGGQVIASRLEALYGLTPEQTSFYNFAAIGKIPPYRNAYRERLNSLHLTAEERQEFIAEATAAFEWNTAVFASLSTTAN